LRQADVSWQNLQAVTHGGMISRKAATPAYVQEEIPSARAGL